MLPLLLLLTQLSFDPYLNNSCIQLIHDAPYSQSYVPSNCGITEGNTIFVVANNTWVRGSTYKSSAANLNCDSYFVDYVTWGPNRFIYSEARDCSTDSYYRNTAHLQTVTPFPVTGLPYGLMLYDIRYPNGYKLTARIAIPEISSTGFARVGMMYHLKSVSTGENLFVEFDAYDSAGVAVCTTPDGTRWSAYCPVLGQSTVFERHKYFNNGVNIPLATWRTLSVNSSEVTAILGRWRPDLCMSDLMVHQVYTALELKNAHGQLQTNQLLFEAN